jgi:DNA polymerase V
LEQARIGLNNHAEKSSYQFIHCVNTSRKASLLFYLLSFIFTLLSFLFPLSSIMSSLKIFPALNEESLELIYVDGGVVAGFPTPAQDSIDQGIDLNRDLISHPESTFYARVSGNSMIDANVFDGDILVVDKSLAVHDGDMAVCVIDGEFTVKYVDVFSDHVVLRPANSDYPPLRIDNPEGFNVWGIVTYVIHKVRG